MSEKHGVIYILTNPSFPDYVKIGYTDNIKKLLHELNRSECIPFAFRVYATYEVNSRLSDLKIHSIIDKLNPGQKRVRGFYAMSPEDAYSILKAIAELNGCTDKLKLIPPSEADVKAANTAEYIEEQKKERRAKFTFSLCQIPVGATIEYCHNDKNSGLTCTVVDDHNVKYNGKKWSLSKLAATLMQSKWSVKGPLYFKYNGEWLNDIRKRLGV